MNRFETFTFNYDDEVIRPAYTMPQAGQTHQVNPLNNLRVGRVEQSLANNTIVFYYRESLDGEWLVDRWTPRQIRNQDMLLYIITAEPGSRYHGYAMATVARDYTMTLYLAPPSGLNDLPDPNEVPWSNSIPRHEARITSDPAAAAAAWEPWWLINTAPDSPQPPGGGPVAAATAESRQLASNQAGPQAQLATASLLASLLVAEAAQPTDAAAEPATGPVQPILEEDELATMDLASRLLLQAFSRLPPATVRTNRSIRLTSTAWDDSIYPPTYVTPQKSIPIASPQKRVADLVIADAISKDASCPISMEQLTKENAACVAPCYHCFEREAIESWLRQATTCPECRCDCSL
jgi:hypothetical protein